MAASAEIGGAEVPSQTSEPVAGTPRDAGAAPATPEGLWPSERLTELAITRWADELSRTYELDDAQRAKVREAAVKRWSTFLRDNRAALQPILNEFIEMRMELEPPAKERVQAWAERASPVFEQVREELNKGTAEFREVLIPVQQAKFDLQALQFGVGMQLAEHKLKQWKQGQFDVNEFWEPTGDRSRRRREEHGGQRMPKQGEERGVTVPAPRETDQIALELDSWDEYVEVFVRLYKLDDGQRTAVLSVLSELKLRAIAHRDRHREEIAELERRIAGFSGADQELTDLKKKLMELYGPVDEMFKELKHRIEQVPTTEQRAAVARPDAANPPTGGTSDTDNKSPGSSE
jgi:hypothetical protein